MYRQRTNINDVRRQDANWAHKQFSLLHIHFEIMNSWWKFSSWTIKINPYSITISGHFLNDTAFKHSRNAITYKLNYNLQGNSPWIISICAAHVNTDNKNVEHYESNLTNSIRLNDTDTFSANTPYLFQLCYCCAFCLLLHILSQWESRYRADCSSYRTNKHTWIIDAVKSNLQSLQTLIWLI